MLTLLFGSLLYVLRDARFVARMLHVPHRSQSIYDYSEQVHPCLQPKINNTIGTYYLIYNIFIPFI